uniref:Uncharacterized protein n=1 Tax=candidate division CPR3 bacterium TaxID=2268181 RepID=A0A7C5Z3D8_UNCC3
MLISFIAEIKEVKQQKLVSLDNQYSIKLITDNSQILDLGKLPPDTLLKVSIEKWYDDKRD